MKDAAFFMMGHCQHRFTETLQTLRALKKI